MADSSEPSPPSTAAAASTVNNDEAAARRCQAMDHLVSTFGFERPVAEIALDAIGSPYDVTMAYNYILDHDLAQDQGGPVTPIFNCPHVDSLVMVALDQLPHLPQDCICDYHTSESSKNQSCIGRSKAVKDESGACPPGENWLCLSCACVRCSRYVNGHSLDHWKETKREQLSSNDDAASGHALVVSLADLSVWCHECQRYLVTHDNPKLQPIVQRLEELKFGQAEQQQPQQSSNKKAKLDSDDDMELVRETRIVGSAAGQTLQSKLSNDDNDASESSDEDPGSIELDLAGPNGRNILDMIRAAAAEQGIPIELILQEAQLAGLIGDENEEIEYPFEEKPNSLESLAQFILSDKCQRILILAGAGMSVASGIPDFRSSDGLYATMNPDLVTASLEHRRKMRVDPSSALDHHFFIENPLPCLELTRDFIIGTREQKWKSTLAHRFVELLHRKLGDKLVRLYTQNIDGLEDQCVHLPRDKVIAVHGSLDRAECAMCHNESDFADFAAKVKTQIKDLSGQDPDAPAESSPIICNVCGSKTVKPSIVLFRASLPPVFFNHLPHDVQDVDLLLVIGTSLRVAPANSIVWRVPRSALRVLVNRDPEGHHLGMNFDEAESKRDYFAAGDCESTLLELMEHLGWLDELNPLLSHHSLPDASAALLRERLARDDAEAAESSDDEGDVDERVASS
ncbi:hypothetical protein MPSEU_000070800 [Mayamaea pseudoterrestris]|nr:hypothetical protein MPSEU_000070800 [Mayamaea pseudoterrestris]